ncbi:MAG: MFS transporter, partial [Candidatus Binatia bacterium]
MTTGKYSETLRHSGLRSLLLTQFLGAFNDNVYLMVVSLLAGEIGVVSGEAGGYVSLVGAIFILPYFLFSGYAGYLSDVFDKRTVLIFSKSTEIVVMGLAWLAFWSGRIELMLAGLFFVALKSTFFSPAKYAILPEMFPDRELSRANGLLEMSTFLAIILGTSIGGIMFAVWKGSLGWIGLVLVLIAIAGTLASWGISRVPPSGARKPFRLNPWAEIGSGIRRLYSEKTLWL